MSVCNQDSSLVYSVMNCHWDRFVFMYQYMRCQSLSMWRFMALVSTDVKISTLQLSCEKAAGRFQHETLDIFEETNKQNKVIEMFMKWKPTKKKDSIWGDLATVSPILKFCQRRYCYNHRLVNTLRCKFRTRKSVYFGESTGFRCNFLLYFF